MNNLATVQIERQLHEGDLIFLDIPNPLFRHVAIATNSWTSHVGIAFQERGRWMVAESAFPVSRQVPLHRFIKRSARCAFEIKRLKRDLKQPEVEKLRSAAAEMLRRWYGLGFDFDSERLFCSKFVHLAYRSIGVEAGRVETFRQLLAHNPAVSTSFWKAWFFGTIPWERRTVTPASQLNDPAFVTVMKGNPPCSK
jgi:hypothetical protein